MNYQKKVPIYRDAVCLVVEIDSAVRGFLYTLNGGMRIIAYGLLTAINNKNNRKRIITIIEIQYPRMFIVARRGRPGININHSGGIWKIITVNS
jgi:hypothetical protein